MGNPYFLSLCLSLILSACQPVTQVIRWNPASKEGPIQLPTPGPSASHSVPPTSTPTPTPTSTQSAPPTSTPTPTSTSMEANTKWVQTWSSALAYASSSFNNQTLRIITRTSLGGSQFRVRLSNQYSNSALTINAAHLAVVTSNDGVDLSTDQALKFSGNSQVTIPAGQDLLSDAVTLNAGSQTKLAVSLYFANSTAALATHAEANATSYVGNGDCTGAANLSGTSSNSWVSVVTGVDVLAPSNTRGVITFGDSITDGVGSSLDAYTRWSDIFVGRLAAAHSANSGLTPVAVSNAGIGGNQVITDISNGPGTASFGQSALIRFAHDALNRSGVTDVIFLEGINDLGYGGSVSTTILNGYSQIATAAHNAGVKIYFGTLTPIRNSTGPLPDEGADGSDCCYDRIDPQRQALNNWIRTTNTTDGFVEFERAVSDPIANTLWISNNSIGDQLHPNNTGHNFMGQAVPLNWFQ